MQVVAEGVETAAQLEFLRGLGCDLIQGYYFSKPHPAADLARFCGALGTPRPHLARGQITTTRIAEAFDALSTRLPPSTIRDGVGGLPSTP